MTAIHTTWHNPDIEVAYAKDDRLVEATPDVANLISSRLDDGMHAPVLDIDFNARLQPSSTKGHFHLYLEKPMTWRKYRRLLRALYKAGIIQKGYYTNSVRRRQTLVRLPWVKKGQS